MCSSVLKFSLFMVAMTAAINAVFGTPAILKTSIADSGIYQSFIPNTLDETLKEQGHSVENVPLNDPEVRSAFQSAFTPELLQRTAEQFIDSIYGWLEGNSPSPDFRIDLTESKQNLVSSLGDYAAKRAAGLPACNFQQLRELQGTDIDPFSVSCLPPGLTPTTVRQQVITDLASSKELLGDPVLTEENLPKNERGQTVFQQASQLPDIYQKAKGAPYFFGLLGLLVMAGVILLNEDRRRGFRIVGYSFLTVGVVVLVSTWLVAYAMGRLKQPNGELAKLSNTNFEHSLVELVSKITSALNSKLYVFCLVYIAIGACVFVVLHRTRPQPAELINAGTPHQPSNVPERDTLPKP